MKRRYGSGSGAFQKDDDDAAASEYGGHAPSVRSKPERSGTLVLHSETENGADDNRLHSATGHHHRHQHSSRSTSTDRQLAI